MGVKRAAAALLLAAGLAPAGLAGQPGADCDPRLLAAWTPRHPQVGRYEVCTTARPIDEVARAGWTVEPRHPLDAFGAAGSYNRPAVLRLYGGRWPSVARGWIDEGGRFESVTLISPYPNRQLTALETGTLVIRYVVRE